MRIRAVGHNNRKKLFEVRVGPSMLAFPYSKAEPMPTSEDPVAHVSVDGELGREGFTFELASGRVGTVHVEQVLEYNQDPSYLRATVPPDARSPAPDGREPTVEA